MTIVNKSFIDMFGVIGKMRRADQQVLTIDADKRQEYLESIRNIIAGYGNYNSQPVVQAIDNIFEHATQKDLATAFIFDRYLGQRGLICRIWDAGEGFDFRGVQTSGDYGDGFKKFNEAGFEVSFEDKGNIVNILYRNH